VSAALRARFALPAGQRRRRAPPSARPRHARAFTLVELLVVIVIVGVLVATLTLTAGGSAGRELQQAAERSRRLIELACERAVLGGRDIGFDAVRDGLRFGYFEVEGWRAIGDSAGDELRPRAWGKGVEVRAERDGEPLTMADEAAAEPPFACLASGELTPLRLEFSRPDLGERWTLDGALDGRLTLAQHDDAR
jgi:general secretion pathway protein H